MINPTSLVGLEATSAVADSIEKNKMNNLELLHHLSIFFQFLLKSAMIIKQSDCAVSQFYKNTRERDIQFQAENSRGGKFEIGEMSEVVRDDAIILCFRGRFFFIFSLDVE